MSTEAHLCRGPDAGQLLGFLCSLGLLETATGAFPDHDIRLGFAWHEVGFRPVLAVAPAVDRGELIERLHERLSQRARSPELTRLGDDLPCDADRFEELGRELLDGPPTLLASFGVAHPESERLHDSAFRTMSGAGHQHFLAFARELAEQTTSEQVDRCLFEPWTYDDPKPSLRFDPADDRRYALRADNPATSSRAPIRTVRAANALAFEGLALLPVVPMQGGAATTLFSRNGRALNVQWPIWQRPIGRDVAAGLLASEASAPGILARFRAQRVTIGKFRSFTPAERVA